MKKSFKHWEDGEYGDVKTHYFSSKLRPKGERTKKLFQLAYAEYNAKFASLPPRTRSPRPRVVEFGCNVGRNLFPFYCLGWEVGGIDLNLESLEAAADLMTECRINFRQLDLFNNVSALSEIPDDRFDVCFCMGFLMHLPDSKNKKKLVSEMIRISKQCYIYEPYDGIDREQSDPEQKGWYLSMLDYEKYNLGLVKHTVTHYSGTNKSMKIWKKV